MRERYSPHLETVVWSPFFSSRDRATPSLIVIHATVSHNVPGLADLEAIGNWFVNPSAQCSSHVCTDNEGHSARYVRDYNKAWHCCAFNRMSLGIEQILPADGGELTIELYRETARWCALWAKKYGIPIQKASIDTATGYVVVPGICRHSDLGPLGGGHTDPGSYDMTGMTDLAKFYRKHI